MRKNVRPQRVFFHITPTDSFIFLSPLPYFFAPTLLLRPFQGLLTLEVVGHAAAGEGLELKFDGGGGAQVEEESLVVDEGCVGRIVGSGLVAVFAHHLALAIDVDNVGRIAIAHGEALAVAKHEEGLRANALAQPHLDGHLVLGRDLRLVVGTARERGQRGVGIVGPLQRRGVAIVRSAWHLRQHRIDQRRVVMLAVEGIVATGEESGHGHEKECVEELSHRKNWGLMG